MKKLIIFQSHPIQYISPLLRELAINLDLKVYYYGGQSNINHDKGFGKNIKWDIPLLNGYNFEFLKNHSRSKGLNNDFFDAVNWSIIKVLQNNRNNIIIINGWSYLTDWLLLILAKFFGNKVWMRSEMPWNQELLKNNSFKKNIKYFLFKHIIFKLLIDKFLYIGSQNKKYYTMHDVDDTRLIFTPYAVDNQFFQSKKINKNIARQQWGINPDYIVVLFSGKLIDKKRPLDLLIAFHQLNDANTLLFYMGDGPLRGELEEYIAKHQIKNVIISGFINQSEIGTIYSMADIFVMCSGVGETWGLSVNEAMNFSLPIVISSTCGSSFDLVEHGKNGFVYNEGDINALKMKLKYLIENPNERKSMGQESKYKISKFSHQVTCDNIMNEI